MKLRRRTSLAILRKIPRFETWSNISLVCGHDDVQRELNKPDNTGIKLRAKDALWKKWAIESRTILRLNLFASMLRATEQTHHHHSADTPKNPSRALLCCPTYPRHKRRSERDWLWAFSFPDITC
jgi:hypothetical protein